MHPRTHVFPACLYAHLYTLNEWKDDDPDQASRGEEDRASRGSCAYLRNGTGWAVVRRNMPGAQCNMFDAGILRGQLLLGAATKVSLLALPAEHWP